MQIESVAIEAPNNVRVEQWNNLTVTKGKLIYNPINASTYCSTRSVSGGYPGDTKASAVT